VVDLAIAEDRRIRHRARNRLDAFRLALG